VVAGAKSAGGGIAAAASKAKTPLIAGGAALAGVAGGLAAKRLSEGSKGPFAKAVSKSPLSGTGSLDLETLTSAGKKVGSFGQQVGDIAAAVENARKKSK
jgi:hypothetical protein